MAANEAHIVRRRIDSRRYAGAPVYYFDTAGLLAGLGRERTVSRERLSSILERRLEGLLNRADVHLAAPRGFFVIFSSRRPRLAEERAQAVRDDILRHFFGADGLVPGWARRFSRPSTLAEAVMTIADAPSPGRTGSRLPPPRSGKNARFAKQGFIPMWDCAHERAAFFCWQASSLAPPSAAGAPPLAVSGAAQAAADIAALVHALRGLCRVLSRGQTPPLMVPVHLETLSWPKPKSFYLREIAQLEARVLDGLAFRIVGLKDGTGLEQLRCGLEMLGGHARRIFVHLPHTGIELSHAGLAGISAIGLSAPEEADLSGENLSGALDAAAAKLTRICAGQRAFSYVDRVTTAAAAELLRSRGIRFIAGPLFGPPSPEPGELRRLTVRAKGRPAILAGG